MSPIQEKLSFYSLAHSLTTSSTPTQRLHVWICPGSTSILVYRPKFKFDLKNTNLDMLAFKQNRTQFQKAQLTPFKTRYAFSRSPLGQELWLQMCL